MRLDLHLHTRHSDGTLTPRELCTAVREASVAAWAVTDHDSLAACQELAQEPGIVPGVEITAGDAGREVHIVALGIDPTHAGLAALLAEIRALRVERLALLIQRLPARYASRLHARTLGDEATESVGRTHLARALRALGAVRTLQEAFTLYLGDDHLVDASLPAFPAIPRVAAAIHAAGGIALLAHPGLYRALPTILALVAQDLDGCEVAHPGLDPTLQAGLLAHVARTGGYGSAGSDLHVLGARVPGMCALPTACLPALCARLGLPAAA